MWPWIERFDFLKAHRNIKFNQGFATKLEKYMENMKKVPAVKKLLISPEKHDRFYETTVKHGVDGIQQECDHGLA